MTDPFEHLNFQKFLCKTHRKKRYLYGKELPFDEKRF